MNLARVGLGQQLAWGTPIRPGDLCIPHSATFSLGTVRSKQTLRNTKDAQLPLPACLKVEGDNLGFQATSSRALK